MKKSSSFIFVCGWFGLLALGACAGGEDDSGSSTPGSASCNALSECCAKMGDAQKQACDQAIEQYTSSQPANAEQWCQQTLEAYEQQNLCEGGTGGSSGTGGAGGTGGSGGSGGSVGGSGGSVGGSGGSVGGSGGGSGNCAHDECTTGDPLEATCSNCAAAVCADDPFCCENSWNDFCVEGAQNLCGLCGGTGGTSGTGGTGGGSSTCAHDECTTGDALDATCSSCVASVCANDPYCCDTNWNSFCVDGARDLCGLCGTVSPCSHDECTTGAALDPSCSTCVETVCNDDPYCCSTSWNGYCVSGAETLCGMSCG